MPLPSQQHAAEELVNCAVAALRAGQLAGLPTETVYGVAASMRSASGIESLKRVLHIQGHPGWVIHVSAAQELAQFLVSIPPVARRLMRHLWPGPLAVQLPIDAMSMERLWRIAGRPATAEALVDGYATFRCPATEITRGIIAGTGEPVIIVGAIGNHRVAIAEDLPEALRDHLAVIIPGPPPRYKKPSTLVRINHDQITVLREGAVAERIIRRWEDMVIVFVCSGNTCRSPMAAGLAAKILAEKLRIPTAELGHHHINIRSAGLCASGGMPAAEAAVKVVSAMGVDIRRHQSAPLTDDLLHRADMIYTMTQAQRDEILSRIGSSSEKIVTLDPDEDIPDPIGGGEPVYRRTAQRMEKLIRNRFAELEL
ncbi:MAG: Sua5/YciO/YrdC/YwlC family protein [Phycisphaerae bacterium]